MNPDEAKVPDDDRNWQSIEIFLFSNGQQYSPPRKYILRADDLNLWDATLNQLAQLHYGLQSPLINLYTTNGHLVKGPVDLSDGHAYVAVAPPDTFVDAGYQKYLIRASRSWEKRQARRKRPECVPDEPCCLCPERERSCCDSEACCLCPEREDADSLEHSLPATGQTELTPAGGHYKSSAPAKSIAADEYVPISDKNGRIPNEYIENKATSGEYLPVLIPDVQNRYAARPGEKVARSDDYVPRKDANDTRLNVNQVGRKEFEVSTSINEVKPGEYGATQDEFETRPNVNRVQPGEYGARQDVLEMRPSVNGAKSGEYGARQGEFDTRLSLTETKPGEYGTREEYYGTRPSVNEVKPSDYGARQGEFDTPKSVNAAKNCEYEAKKGEYGAQPGDYGTRPSVNEVKPGEYGARQGEFDTPKSVNGAKKGEYEAKKGEYGAQLGDYGTRPSVDEVKPGEYGVRQGQFDIPQSVHGAKPGEYGANQDEYKTRTSINESKPGEYGARNGQYETRPSVNKAEPGEYGVGHGKNETRLSLNTVKPGEYGATQDEFHTRPSFNGPKPGEYEALQGEYANRPSVYEVKPGEYGARQGEFDNKSGEYEIKPRVNGAKPNKYGHRSSLKGSASGENDTNQYKPELTMNGSKTGGFIANPDEHIVKQGECQDRPVWNAARSNANGVTPGELRTRPVEYGAKSDEYDAQPSLYEILLGEHGARPGENETRPSSNGAKPRRFDAELTEYGVLSGECKNGTKKVEYETTPDEYKVEPGKYDTKQSINGANLGECKIKVRVNGEQSSKYGARTDENGNKQSVNETYSREVRAIPKEYVTNPRVSGAKPGKNEARQVEYETILSLNEAKPDFITKSENETQFAKEENRPAEYIPSPTKNSPWSGDDGVRTTGIKARPGHSGPWLSKIEPIKEAYETALRDKDKEFNEREDRPDKEKLDKDASIECVNEYRTRGGNQVEKENESEDRSSGNRGRISERKISGGAKNITEIDAITGASESKARKIENPSRQSRRGSAEIKQGERTGVPTREFEHSGRASAQKSKETNSVGRSGQEARLSEQKHKLNDNLARLGSRNSRVGDHEAKAGDLGFQISGHGAELGNSGSRRAESGAKAAVSGSKASPRDRISPRINTGNLGQQKLGTTKVEETLARSDDSEIKNRERRQSRVGTGTVGALQISEDQQHARKNRLSTGRPSIEKKRLLIGQNSSLLGKPPPNSSILRKPEDKQPLNTNRGNLSKKINETIPIPASNDIRNPKTQSKSQRVAPPTLSPATIYIKDQANLKKDKDLLDDVIYEKEINIISTHSFKNPESETKSMKLDSLKHGVEGIQGSSDETQTELIYTENSMACVSVNEGVQTRTETIEQQGQEVSTSKEKVNSCTCSLCRQTNHRAASDSDENTLSMVNKGGVVNIKLNIEVRNIVKSVYSCQKNCGRSQSLTNITRSEKESQISVNEDVLVNRNSLKSLFTKQNLSGFGFGGSPKVMVVQCAGSGKSNNSPRGDPPPCCNNNKKYFVLLNSVLEDMDDGCNFNPPCRPCDKRQSRKQSSSIPIKPAMSETMLDTITTVTVSGVPLQRREMGKCTVNTSSQTEEPQNECMTDKRNVSITQNSVTCDLQKKTNSSISVATHADCLVPKQSLKMCSQKCEHVDSQVYSELCRAVRLPTCEKRSDCSEVPPSECEKVRSDCSQVNSQACSQVHSKGCQPIGPQVQSQACMPIVPPCPRCCIKTLPPCLQVQIQACPRLPQCCDAETQTRWASTLARLHNDGRYSFHLPPLYMLKNHYS